MKKEMTELDVVKYLQKQYNSIVNTRYRLIACYYDKMPGIEKLNFKIIKEMCKQLGFDVYKANNCPIDQKNFKKLWNASNCLIVCSERTLGANFTFER